MSDLSAVDDVWGDPPPPVPADDSAYAPAVGQAADPGSVVLDANPDARALREALLGALDTGAPVVEAGGVERLTPAAFQVLLAAMRDAAAAGARLVVRNPSFAFSLTFEAFGLGGDNEPFTVEYC